MTRGRSLPPPASPLLPGPPGAPTLSHGRDRAASTLHLLPLRRGRYGRRCHRASLLWSALLGLAEDLGIGTPAPTWKRRPPGPNRHWRVHARRRASSRARFPCVWPRLESVALAIRSSVDECRAVYGCASRRGVSAGRGFPQGFASGLRACRSASPPCRLLLLGIGGPAWRWTSRASARVESGGGDRPLPRHLPPRVRARGKRGRGPFSRSASHGARPRAWKAGAGTRWYIFWHEIDGFPQP